MTDGEKNFMEAYIYFCDQQREKRREFFNMAFGPLSDIAQEDLKAAADEKAAAAADEYHRDEHGLGQPPVKLLPANYPIGGTPSLKDTNPKDAVGTAKVPYSCLSGPVLTEMGLAMMEGARKYGRHNWRQAGIRTSVYYDACLRHLIAWWEGEDIDPDSGVHHVTKAISGLHVLRDAQIRGAVTDDRPPVSLGFIKTANDQAKDIIDRYPNAVNPVVKSEKS